MVMIQYPAHYDVLNSEHDVILDLITKIREAADTGDAVAFKRHLDQVIAVKRIHFAREEQIMAECGYPDYRKHKAYHAATLEDLTSLVWLFDDMNLSLAGDQVAQHIHNWLDENLAMDRPLAEFLAEQAEPKPQPARTVQRLRPA